MILVSDFDDTLYPHGDEAAFQENLRAVLEFRKRPGNEFVLATGRSLSSVKRSFPDFRKYMDYVILDNGAICYDTSTNTAVLEYKIPQALAQEIMELIYKLALPGGGEAVYYFDFVEHADLEQDLTKLRYWTENEAATEQIVGAINTTYGDMVKAYVATGVVFSTIPWIDAKDYRSFADIVPVEAGKENMIKRFQREYYPQDNVVITVGDSYNDIDMLKRFDGYVVARARADVRAAVPADHVVPQVSDLIAQLL